MLLLQAPMGNVYGLMRLLQTQLFQLFLLQLRVQHGKLMFFTFN